MSAKRARLHIAIRDMQIGTSMKQHSGMRPQDIVVMLKIIALGDSPWRIIDIATALAISQSEVSEALNRNMIAGLMDSSKRSVHKEALTARGGTDIRLSPDFVDVVYLLDSRRQLPQEVGMSDSDVSTYTQTALADLLRNPSLPEAIEAALGFGSARERAKMVESIMESIGLST